MTRKEIKSLICQMSFINDDEKIILYQRIIKKMEYNGGFIDLPPNRAALLALIA